MPSVRPPKDDAKRLALLEEITMVIDHIRDRKEGYSTLLTLRGSVWKLEALLEEESW